MTNGPLLVAPSGIQGGSGRLLVKAEELSGMRPQAKDGRHHVLVAGIPTGLFRNVPWD